MQIMNKILSRPKVAAGVTTAAVAVALVIALGMTNANRGLKKNLNKEKLNSEKLLSEKLALDKEIEQHLREIEQFKAGLDNYKGKNDELDKMLTEARKNLSQKQDEINRLAKANAGKKAIEKELAALKKLKNDFDSQISLLDGEIQSLKTDKKNLLAENSSLNKKVSELEARNSELAANVKMLQSMVADDYLVQGLKGKKEKFTFVARKTDKLSLTFDIPEDFTSSLKFKILTPDGKTIQGEEEGITTTLINNSGEKHSGGDGSSGYGLDKRVKMEYDPRGKFARGIYKIEIFNGDDYLGSCQVRLK